MKNYQDDYKKRSVFLTILMGVLAAHGQIQSAAQNKHAWIGELFAKEKAREEYERKKREAEVTGDIDQKLINAAHMHNEELVKRLLGAGAKVNARKKNDGSTPLMNVVTMSSVNTTGIPIAQILLNAGADLNAQDNDGVTPFALTACWSNLEMARFFINAGFTAIDGQLHDGRTALMIAAQQGCKDIVKMLLGKRANINVKDAQGFTALTAAALQFKSCTEQRRPDYEEVIKDLMDAGAQVDKETLQQYPEMQKLVAQKFKYYMDLMKECVHVKTC